MTTLNRDAARTAVARGYRCATDVTGFGLLGHLLKLARASGVTAVVDSAAVEYLDGARQAVADGFVSGGTRRNLDWVRPDTRFDISDETEALLLADAQTSGGLLVAGEMPGATGRRRAGAARRAPARRPLTADDKSRSTVGSVPEVFVGWCRPRPSKPFGRVTNASAGSIPVRLRQALRTPAESDGGACR